MKKLCKNCAWNDDGKCEHELNDGIAIKDDFGCIRFQKERNVCVPVMRWKEKRTARSHDGKKYIATVTVCADWKTVIDLERIENPTGAYSKGTHLLFNYLCRAFGEPENKVELLDAEQYLIRDFAFNRGARFIEPDDDPLM